jgi:hypothetical protein
MLNDAENIQEKAALFLDYAATARTVSEVASFDVAHLALG